MHMQARAIDSTIIRLERAGGNMSEAIERVPTSIIRNQMTTVNILIGDLRRAMVRLSNGEAVDQIEKDLMEHLISTK
jgi:hypothetical protein